MIYFWVVLPTVNHLGLKFSFHDRSSCYPDIFLSSIIFSSSGTASASNQSTLALPAPASSSSPKAPAAPVPVIDLLSGDDYIKPEPANSLALVPVTEYSAADQNVLALADMFEQNNANRSNNNLTNSFNTSAPNSNFPASQAYPAPVQPALPQHPVAYSNGVSSNAIVPYYGNTLLSQACWYDILCVCNWFVFLVGVHASARWGGDMI